MARSGDELRFSKRQTLIVRTPARESGGDLLEVESTWQPGADEPVAHYHPAQEERFEILEGTLGARIGGEERTLSQGDLLVVPAGTVHSMWNAGDGQARARWETRPALRTEEFFETYAGLARDGRVNAKGLPNPLQLAVLMREYDGEFRLAKPPRPVQRLVFGPLAALARLLGYRGRYDEYSGAPEARGPA